MKLLYVVLTMTLKVFVVLFVMWDDYGSGARISLVSCIPSTCQRHCKGYEDK